MNQDRRLGLHLGPHGRLSHRQPPYRIQYCLVPPRDSLELTCNAVSCHDAATQCMDCLFYYCGDHDRHHRQFLSLPADAWKGLHKRLWLNARRLAGPGAADALFVPRNANRRFTQTRIGDVLVDDKPPVRIQVCTTPSTGHIDLPCGHRSKQCKGAIHTCRHCWFTYCVYHGVRHRRTLALPRSHWMHLVTSYRRQANEFASGKRWSIRLHPRKFKPLKRLQGSASGEPGANAPLGGT